MLILSHPPPALSSTPPRRTQNLILLRYLRSSGGGGTLKLVHALLDEVLDLLDGCGRERMDKGKREGRVSVLSYRCLKNEKSS